MLSKKLMVPIFSKKFSKIQKVLFWAEVRMISKTNSQILLLWFTYLLIKIGAMGSRVISLQTDKVSAKSSS